MDKRTKMLLLTALSLAGVFFVYSVLYKPWMEKSKKLDADIKKVSGTLKDHKTYLQKRDQIESDWRKIEADVRDPQRPTLQNDFESYMRLTLTDVTILDNARRPTLTPKEQPDRIEDFTEWVVEAKGARFRIEEFRKFLEFVRTAKEFVKMRTLNVTTRDDGDLMADFSFSTIEYAPVVTRTKP